MKPMPPAHWTLPELALFAGMISGSVGLVTLAKIIERLHTVRVLDDEQFFRAMIADMREHVPDVTWDLRLNTCRRLFP